MGEMTDDEIQRVTDFRSAQLDTRDFVPDRHRIGWAGEQAFAERFGLPMDTDPEPGTGADFEIDLRLDDGSVRTFSVDVKCYRTPYNLLVPEGEVHHDLYVLSQYHDNAPAELLGWTWGVMVQHAPVRRFGYPIKNHYVPRSQLRDLGELAARHDHD